MSGLLWFTPDSVELICTQMSYGRDTPIGREAEETVLQRLVEERECPWCGVPPGVLCLIYGGRRSLRRSHPVRLRMPRSRRLTLVRWALDKTAADADDDLQTA